MGEAVKKILNAITTFLVVVVVIFTIALVGTRPFDIYPYTVLSGSMEPEYPTGSLIYVKKANPDELEVGDVITYMASRDTTVTHRIVEIVPDENDPSIVRYATQGDANEYPDSQLVHQDNVIGEPVLCIPYLGYAVNKVLTPPGTYLAVSFVAVIVFLMFLPDLFSSKEDEDDDMPAPARAEKEDLEPVRGAHAKSAEGSRSRRQVHEGRQVPANQQVERQAPSRRAYAGAGQPMAGPSTSQQSRRQMASQQRNETSRVQGGVNNPRLNKQREAQSAAQGTIDSRDYHAQRAVQRERYAAEDGRNPAQVRPSNRGEGF